MMISSLYDTVVVTLVLLLVARGGRVTSRLAASGQDSLEGSSTTEKKTLCLGKTQFSKSGLQVDGNQATNDLVEDLYHLKGVRSLRLIRRIT